MNEYRNNVNEYRSNENEYEAVKADAVHRLKSMQSQSAKGILLIAVGAFFLIIPGYGLIIAAIIFYFGFKKVSGVKKNMRALYKQIFVEEPLKRNFYDVTYQPDNGFDREIVRNFGLCKMGNRYYTEDYIRASYEGVTFEMADVIVRYHQKTGDDDITITYFQGRMMTFSLPDKMLNSVRVFSDSFRNRALDKKEAKNELVQMESVDFNRLYDVFAPDAHDAFYLLTPPLMERLISLASRYNSMAFSVVGNQVVVAFNEPGNDAFDSKNLYGQINYEEEIVKVQKDIDDIKIIISQILALPGRYPA